MDETPKVKSKNLDVVAAYSGARGKRDASFIVIGISLFGITCEAR